MEQAIIDRYQDAILQQALQRYDIAHDQIRLLGACESFIYGFERAAQGYILRITRRALCHKSNLALPCQPISSIRRSG